MDLPPKLADLQRFHGHLGVYVTLGLRMGEIGKRRFGHYKGLHARVESQPEPPMRCVVDGIQFSSGCTMGKGNIDRKSTRLNSSHDQISYAVFCLKKKK